MVHAFKYQKICNLYRQDNNRRWSSWNIEVVATARYLNGTNIQSSNNASQKKIGLIRCGFDTLHTHLTSTLIVIIVV